MMKSMLHVELEKGTGLWGEGDSAWYTASIFLHMAAINREVHMRISKLC